MKSVNPQTRRGIIGGRTLVELIRSVLEVRIGVVAEVIDARVILETLLEEYFYGGSFQDDFYEQLSALNVPTDMIHFARREILSSIGHQVRLVFGDIRPCNSYGFQIMQSDDVCITETCPSPLRKPTSSED
jgi:hypothetical protein